MKKLSTTLQELLESDTINFVKCYKFTLKNGTLRGFTDFSENIFYDGLNYESNTIFKSEKIINNVIINKKENTIYGCIDKDFTENDIRSNKFINAKLEIFLIHYLHTSAGSINIFTGYIKSIDIYDNIFVAKVVNILEHINNKITETYSELCRCSFCDSRCTLNKNNYKTSGTVNSTINCKNFSTTTESILNKSNGYYNNGIIEFTSGLNNGCQNEIKYYSDGNFILKYPMPSQISINDTFNAYKNCDKHFKTCIETYNNAKNFRGEPNLPRSEKIYKMA